ncbi:MAG TPA: hypothetical protein VGJ04_02390 [Pirellulales bacterium]|jgi:hypothetical protein
MKSTLACRLTHSRRLYPALIALGVLAIMPAAALAQRSSAENLLPKDTLAYIHVASVPDLVAAFQQTNLGRLFADPQVQPFVTKLYDAANKALFKVKEATGLSLDEIAHIPQGEITFALLPRANPQTNQSGAGHLDLDSPIAFIAMVDCGNSIESARKFVDTIHAAMIKDGFTGREETVDGVIISIYQRGGGDPSPLVSLERDNTIVVCSTADIARQLLARWTTTNQDCLAENPRFASIMNRCRGPKDEEPHLTFFADPIGFVTVISQNNPAVKLGMALLPTLGLDGIKAVGGSYVIATEDFDGIMQLHLSLGSPRSGVLELIALDSGDDTPPPWVPGDIAGYISLHWNFQQTFEKGTKLADSFQGQGVMAKNINDRAQRWLGIDVEHDILPSLTGRALQFSWFDQPVKPGIGGHNLIAVQVRDARTFADAFQKITSHLGPKWQKKGFAAIDYYQLGAANGPDDIRPTPCLAMLNDWVLVTDRTGILEHVLSRRDETENNLALALDYKLIASKIAQQPGGDKPAMLLFNRPDAGWKYLYDLANSDQARQILQQRAGSNPFFTALHDGLDQNPLPPWEVIARYLAPEGAMFTDDDSGIHYMAFALRRK